VTVDPLINAEKSLAHGPGLETNTNRDGEQTHFTIETRLKQMLFFKTSLILLFCRDKDGKPVGALGKGLPFKVTQFVVVFCLFC
jgi:hypothetical protein